MNRRAGHIGAAITLAVVSLVAVPPSTQADPFAPDEERFIAQAEEEGPQRVIVELEQSGFAAQSSVLNRLTGDGFDFELNARYRIFPGFALTADSATLRELAGSDDVRRIMPDRVLEPALDSSIGVINADEVHERGQTGSGQAVVIIDSGIDRDHPFFDGRVVAEACFSSDGDGMEPLCPNGETSQTGPGSADATYEQCIDDDGANMCDHGSQVAGVAAGRSAAGAPGNGVAPDADIIAIQVNTRFDLDECQPGFPCSIVGMQEADVMEALEFVDQTLRAEHDIAAVNLSLGDTKNHTSACDDYALEPVITSLLSHDVATVVASGNDGHGAGVSAPACVSSAVAIGATDDDDVPWSEGNRGSMLDLFAPGVDITSAVPDDDWTDGDDDGTSLAAPHVAGGLAVMRAAQPDASVTDLLEQLTSTGEPITYDSGGEDVTTPRIDLLAATEEPNEPPGLSVDNPVVTVDEGTTAVNGGNATDPNDDPLEVTASVGTVSVADGRWSWSFTPADESASQSVTITGTDADGESDSVSFELVVRNAPPRVEFSTDAPRAEGNEVTVTGRVIDPGWLDPLTATIDWGEGTSGPLDGTLENDPPDATLSFETSHVYGDNGTFTIEICGSDGQETRCADEDVRIDNVDPQPEIDKSDAVETPEGPTIVAKKGDDVALAGRVTDPGSDDLMLAWDFGDGEPSPDREVTSLVNPPDPDPANSPSVQPRDITDETAANYTRACVYDVTFDATDDDDGTGADQVAVVVQDRGLLKKLATVWYVEFLVSSLPPDHLPDDILECYLDIAEHMSAVFTEVTDASTISAARDVLRVRLLPTPEQAFDRQLLAAWLNFAHGPFELDDPVDSTCDLQADSTFAEVVRRAEAVRTDPDSTPAEIREQASRLTHLNLCNPLP